MPVVIVDAPNRLFHLEVLKGGMNRLVLRSNRSEHEPTRLEVMFMGVKYLMVGTSFDGLTIIEMPRRHAGSAMVLGWTVPSIDEMRWFRLDSRSGSGLLVAGGVATDESGAGPADPSRFFMMD